MKIKKRVLFVGSFVDKASDGSVGGQMYACKSLVDSNLSDHIEWILLDTTGKSVPPPSLIKRGLFAINRLFKFVFSIVSKRPSSILIFAGSGASVYEKGVMILIGKLFLRKVIFAPRGGGLVDEIAQSKFFKLYVRLVFYFSDNIICQGNYWLDFFKSILLPENHKKLVVVSNWIDLEKYNISLNEDNENKENEISIISMGWMEKEKGVQDLFEALILLKPKDVKINIYFLGDGSLRNILLTKSKKISKDLNMEFHFPGWIYGDKKIGYLRNADIFVLSSYFEGMPNSLIEAMASKTACISTEVGSVNDIIDNNLNGFLYKPGDIEKLSELIQKLIDSSETRHRFSDLAFDKIYNNNSLSSAVRTFQQIL